MCWIRYSGDWSRIGVISKETEDLLKIAAYLVTPFPNIRLVKEQQNPFSLIPNHYKKANSFAALSRIRERFFP
ncbi:hypothetical protein BHM03_00058845, partial [Ensete ventricosum]